MGMLQAQAQREPTFALGTGVRRVELHAQSSAFSVEDFTVAHALARIAHAGLFTAD
jgi:hypothetical protein